MMYALAVVTLMTIPVAVALAVARRDDQRRAEEFRLVEARDAASEALSRLRHPSSAQVRHLHAVHPAPRHLRLVKGGQ